MKIRSILSNLPCISSPYTAVIEPFLSVEDGAEYDVWQICDEGQKYVLKKAKEYELWIYSHFFCEGIKGVPRFLESVTVDNANYFLMEYISGKDICKCNRHDLILTLDALILIQDAYWGNKEPSNGGYSFDESMKRRINRLNYLGDDQLERFYKEFLDEYRHIPRTLCHDDLLPFNVLVSFDGACLIDWELGGILPYPVSLARLIAHCEECDGAPFYMSGEDKEFAVEYYFEKLVKKKGIDYTDYRHSLDLFLLYEYCEWIMLGNKYDDADMDMFDKYVKKANDHIKNRLSISY